MSSLEKQIAKAIKKADRSYFLEDYNKQAKAVLVALDREGFKVVPKEASEEMMEAGVNGIRPGKVRPNDLAKMIYEAMVKAAKI